MRIAVLTSGGDAPGMNAAIRTVAAVGMGGGHDVLGVRGGYEGLLTRDLVPLDLARVEGISRFGGTLLGSARNSHFRTDAGQQEAMTTLRDEGVDALVVIGGDGSLTGAHRLAALGGCTVVGIPASIDNDIGHTGLSIGVDTAVNTIVEACDRISDTARAHRRAFVVEVMGRRSGFLAMRAGIAAEADAILYGEHQQTEPLLLARLERVLAQCFRPGGHKRRALIIKAEGVDVPTERIVAHLQGFLDANIPGVHVRTTVLGHVVRGGSPTVLDRILAQRLAFAAVRCCEAGVSDVMAAWEAPGAPGSATEDPSVRIVPLRAVLEETARLCDGTSEVVQRRVALLEQVEHLLSL